MTRTSTRIERDTFGPIEVPADQLWGAQTQRSLEFFRISTEKMPPALIRSMLIVKRSAARVNVELGLLDAEEGQCDRRGVPTRRSTAPSREEFPLAVWQTGSGTQTNMNVNEVLANRASEILGGSRGEGRLVHPNDDVNRGQSSNDVFPTAMNIAAAERRCREIFCLRSNALQTDTGSQGGGVHGHRQDRPHAPAGCHAAYAGPGVLRLCRAARILRAAHIEAALPHVLRTRPRRHGGGYGT